MRIILWITLLTGCARVENPFHGEVPADGVYRVEGNIENGDFSYVGEPNRNTISWDGVSYGYAGCKRAAEEHEAGNQLSTSVEGDTLVYTVRTDFSQAGIDTTMSGPAVMDLDVDAPWSDTFFSQTDGVHVATSYSVNGELLTGNVDFYATSGEISVDVWPYEAGDIVLETESGPVTLYLPYGLGYDIEVFGDPEYEAVVTNLGFKSEYFGTDGYYSARSGDELINVRVYINGGGFYLYEAL